MKMLRPPVRVLSRAPAAAGAERSPDAAERRRLYHSARWLRLRDWFLRHQPLCAMCSQAGRITVGTVLDHVDGHGPGWRERFWDQSRMQVLCVDCHAEKAKTELAKERRP